jgi:hypothetical protein
MTEISANQASLRRTTLMLLSIKSLNYFLDASPSHRPKLIQPLSRLQLFQIKFSARAGESQSSRLSMLSRADYSDSDLSTLSASFFFQS